MDRLLLFTFAASTGLLSGYGQARLIGIALVVSFLALYATNSSRVPAAGRGVPPELICYTLWVAWATLTGPLVADNLALFWIILRTVLQILVMVWTVYGLLRLKMTPQVVFAGLFCSGLIQIGSVVANFSEPVISSDIEMAVGLTTNANGFGYILVTGVIGAMLLWHGDEGPPSLLRRVILLGLIVLSGYAIVNSGSKKSLLIYAVVVLAWATLVVPKGRDLQRFLIRAGILVLVLASAYFAHTFVMEDSAFGKRWYIFVEKEGGGDFTESVVRNERYRMYVEGLHMVAQAPVAGVGLGQFVMHYSRLVYSHSDLIESLSTTGIVGFILYQSFYVVLLVRLRRLIRLCRNEVERYRLKTMVLAIISALLFGLGSPHVTSPMTFLLLVTISAFTWTRYQELRAGRGPMPMGEPYSPQPVRARVPA